MKSTIKNQISKSKVRITVIAFAIFSMFCIGCTPTTPVTPTCSNTNTDFQQLYNSVVATAGNVNDTTYDSETHEYSFTVTSNKIVCQIGYSGQNALPSGGLTYNMQLRDSSTNTSLFSINTSFDSLQTSYVSVPNITLVPGHIYTVKRTITNYYSNYIYTIGRMVHQNGSFTPLTFPKSYGSLTIVGSKFYDNAIPQSNIGIPFIDIVFQ